MSPQDVGCYCSLSLMQCVPGAGIGEDLLVRRQYMQGHRAGIIFTEYLANTVYNIYRSGCLFGKKDLADPLSFPFCS